jgi:hypothetical protein
MFEERHVVVVAVVAFIEPAELSGKDSVDKERGAMGQSSVLFCVDGAKGMPWISLE